MPSRRISEEYYQLIALAQREGGAFVALPSAEAARNLRSYLYHFRRILREADHPAAEFASSLKLQVEPGGLRLALPTAPEAEAIQATLNEAAEG